MTAPSSCIISAPGVHIDRPAIPYHHYPPSPHGHELSAAYLPPACLPAPSPACLPACFHSPFSIVHSPTYLPPFFLLSLSSLHSRHQPHTRCASDSLDQGRTRSSSSSSHHRDLRRVVPTRSHPLPLPLPCPALLSVVHHCGTRVAPPLPPSHPPSGTHHAPRTTRVTAHRAPPHNSQPQPPTSAGTLHSVPAYCITQRRAPHVAPAKSTHRTPPGPPQTAYSPVVSVASQSTRDR